MGSLTMINQENLPLVVSVKAKVDPKCMILYFLKFSLQYRQTT